MTELTAFAGEPWTRAIKKAEDSSKSWDRAKRIDLPAEGMDSVLKALDNAFVTAKTLEDMANGMLYVRALLRVAVLP